MNWNVRNLEVWINDGKKLEALVEERATRLWTQWQHPQLDVVARVSMCLPLEDQRWLAPPSGCIKCNFDVAIFSKIHRMGVGFII